MRFDRLLLLKKGGHTVYFGDLGENADSMIGYFERNGGRSISSWENPAEYMLDVIGAGATASSAVEWNSVWKTSPEAAQLQDNLERIQAEGRSRPAVVGTQHGTSVATTTYPECVWQLRRRASSLLHGSTRP